jgi:hypothetical protein
LCFYGCECDWSMFGKKGERSYVVALGDGDPRILALTGRKRGVYSENKESYDFLLGQRSLRTWLKRLSDTTRENGLGVFRRWWAWLEFNHPEYHEMMPDGLVNWLDDPDVNRNYIRDRKRVLRAVQDWILELDGADSTLRSYEQRLRSFFAHNDVELPRTRYFKANATRAKLVSQISIDDFRALYSGADPLLRVMMICSVMGGMGRAELLYWSEHGLETLREQLRDDPTILKVDLPGRKAKKFIDPYYTYLGRDAIKELRSWLKVRDRVANCDHIFVNKYGRALVEETFGGRWVRLVKRVGLAREKQPGEGSEYRTGKHFHEIRDTFKTRASFCTLVPDKWSEFFMGHTIDSLGYNKAMKNEGFMKAQYINLEPYLNLMSADPMSVDIYELAKIKAEHNDNMTNVKSAMRDMAEAIQVMGVQLNKVKKNSPEDKVHDMQDRIDRLQAEMVAMQDD